MVFKPGSRLDEPTRAWGDESQLCPNRNESVEIPDAKAVLAPMAEMPVAPTVCGCLDGRILTCALGSRATLNLTLATIAFTICFTSWGLVAPLAKHLQAPNGWSDTQVLLLAAVPVLCGSLLRLPAGWLADRFGGRLIFTVTMVLSIVPALLLGYVTNYDALLVVGFFMGAAGSAFAVGVPFVVGWYQRSRQGFAVGVYALGTIGPAIALLVVPRTLDRYGQAYLGWGMAVILAAGRGHDVVSQQRRAEPAEADPLRRHARRWVAAVEAGAAVLPDLRRVRGDVHVPAEAADQVVCDLGCGRRSARRRVLPRSPWRRALSAAGSRTATAARRSLPRRLPASPLTARSWRRWRRIRRC